jgi:hypothetical protein
MATYNFLAHWVATSLLTEMLRAVLWPTNEREKTKMTIFRSLALALLAPIVVGAQRGSAIIRVFNYPDVRWVVRQPVEITTLRLEGRIIKPEQPTIYQGSWADTLEIDVKNVSDKVIKYIQVNVAFDDLSEGVPSMPDVIMYAGRRSDFMHTLSHTKVHNDTELTLKPGDIATIRLTPVAKSDLQYSIENLRPPANILDRPRLRVHLVFYDDETGWGSGSPMRRTEGHWQAVHSDEVSKAGRRKGSHFSRLYKHAPYKHALSAGGTRTLMTFRAAPAVASAQTYSRFTVTGSRKSQKPISARTQLDRIVGPTPG